MSTLSYQTIKQLCINVELITPWSEKTVFQGMTYGLSQNGYDIRIAETITLYPVSLKNLFLKALGFKRPSFSLSFSIENFNIPNYLKFGVADKSSWARRGLAVQNTIGEAGWRVLEGKDNRLTLELTNHGDEIITIEAGSPIAQVVFDYLDKPTEQPYKGKYSSQPARPVSAIYENS